MGFQRRSVHIWASLGVVMAAFIGACGPTGAQPGGTTTAGTGGAGGAGGSGGSGCDVSAVFERNGCITCHGQTPAAGLDLRPDGLASRLVGIDSRVPGCDGRLLIDPVDPAQSQILTVLSPPAAGALCTVAMPPGKPSIPAEDVQCLANWVETFKTSDPPLPFEPVSAESALTKIKMLLTGQAPTASELALVNQDKANLRTLVEGWVETDAFYRKTKDYFRLLLQQKQRPTDWRQIDGSNHAGVPDELGNAVEESVVQTAVDIVKENRPFTDIFTTRRWKVTTAQLVLMRYTDQTKTERLQLAHKLVATQAEADPLQGLWYVPGIPPTCRDKDGPKLSVPEILRLQWGHLRCRNIQDYRFYDTARMSRSGPDYSDYRYVEFAQADPNGPMDEPPFWDVDSWRNVQEGQVVKSRLPRVGFMTTPAFFNNWETNLDNQFRVTLHQTLIVALQGSFRVGEPTTPVNLDGVDQAHADPNSACFGCHRQLDPMRVWFQNAFGTDYQSVASGLPTYTPGFAFGGATYQGGDFDAFAQFLVTHPMVPIAWAQKLCWIANGEACNASDPELARIAAEFQKGFSWKKLVIELFSSPLVTGFSETATWKGRDIPASLVRAQHLCAAIDQREVGGLCATKTVREPLALIPDDGFNRAVVDPDVPRETTAFSVAALERLCMALADKLVGGGAKPYDPTTPDVTIPAIVEGLVGLPPGHSRHDMLVTGLKDHYNDAITQGATPDNAMKSALILGCLSPDAAGLGL